MSVYTKADENLQTIKDKINDSYTLLLETLKPDTWGINDFDKKYIDTLHQVLNDLYNIKSKL